MKYEIIFKSGKVKNVISKDANKIKNYITESFNKIQSVKRLNEGKGSQKIKDLLNDLCHELDQRLQFKQYDIEYSNDGNYYIAYVTNTDTPIENCIKIFNKVMNDWRGNLGKLPRTINCKVYFASRDYNYGRPERVWDIEKCMKDSDMYNIAFQISNDDDTNYITYYNSQIPERKAEGMYSIVSIDELGGKNYIIKSAGGYSTTDDIFDDWDKIYKTIDKKRAKEEVEKIIKFIKNYEDEDFEPDIRIVKTPAKK